MDLKLVPYGNAKVKLFQRKLVFKKEIVEESMRKTVLKKSLYHFLYKLSLNQRKGMKSIQSIALCLKVIIF